MRRIAFRSGVSAESETGCGFARYVAKILGVLASALGLVAGRFPAVRPSGRRHRPGRPEQRAPGELPARAHAREQVERVFPCRVETAHENAVGRPTGGAEDDTSSAHEVAPDHRRGDPRRLVERRVARRPDDAARIAEAIATAAVRYFMVKFSRGKVIVFDIDEALSFEGESGPYLQYAAVRANNIFHKMKERHGLDEGGALARVEGLPADVITQAGNEADELWGLVLEAARLDDVVDQSVRTLELSVVAKYAFALAQQFNGFYHAYPVLKEDRADVRLWRAAAIAYYRQQLTQALDLMGCTVPERM